MSADNLTDEEKKSLIRYFEILIAASERQRNEIKMEGQNVSVSSPLQGLVPKKLKEVNI